MKMFDEYRNSRIALEFEEVLRQNNFEGGIDRIINESIKHGILFSLLCCVFVFLFSFSLDWQVLILFSGFFFPFLARVFFHYYFFDYKRKKISELTPDFLLQASLFPKGTSLKQFILYFSKSNYAYLSTEFKKALNEIEKGASPTQALLNVKKRVKSPVLDRAIDLLVQGIESGADAASVFKETALDLLETNSILRERNAALIIEKYTLLFAGGIIVPLTLGIAVGVISGMDFDALSEIGLGLAKSEKKALFEAAMLSNYVYLVEYSLIASFFVAFTESDLKKGVIYALLLVPLSLFVFSFFLNA